ncbi:hypothetical protein BV898_05250 [Hypsibius exemplaris]|uniref:Uncharacterized protein n=1 Tax=Hypsibius exemplaris TaxID=2072580 RepID=A0A1W0WZL7_HYPEX|nr:hypothetical protein BV898_05250 [Hypsibius exemplaris]
MEEMIVKLALLLHVLVHSLMSYKSTGSIDIPLEVSHDILKYVIYYDTTSHETFKIFLGANILETSHTNFIMFDGQYVFPCLVYEACNGRKLPKFGEASELKKTAMLMEAADYGRTGTVKMELVNGVRFDMDPGPGKWSRVVIDCFRRIKFNEEIWPRLEGLKPDEPDMFLGTELR